MKTYIASLLFCLFITVNLQGQIKIGENPQTLHPASVLELESTSRALVITRLTNTQMNNMAPLRGALVYNTDEECIHYYDGTQWVNICEALDNSFTVTTEAIFNTSPNVKDSTVVVTQVGDNYNFEVNQIVGDNIVDRSILGTDIGFRTVATNNLVDDIISTIKLDDDSVTKEKINLDVAGAGLRQNAATGALEVDVTSLTGSGSITSTDITVTDGSSATFRNVSLEIANNAITTNKIAPGAVESTDIAADAVNAATINVDVAGAGLQQNITTGALEVNTALLTGNGDITSTDLAVTGGTDATFGNVSLELAAGAVGNTEIANNAVTTDKIAPGAVESTDIAADAVNAATINVDVAGAGLQQNITTGALEVNTALLTGNGDITSTDLAVTGGTDATFGNVSLEIATGAVGNTEIANNAVTTDKIAPGAVESTDIAADAVNAATINVDVAGTGLTQNAATGALDVDITTLAGDITSTDLAVTGGTDATFGDVSLEIAAGAVGNTEIANNAVTTDKIAPGAVESTDIAADAVNAATINVDVAGTGLTQNAATGALDVDITTLAGDITSTDLAVTGGTDATFGDVSLEIAAGAVGNTEIANDAITTNKITDGNVTLAKIEPSATNEQVLTTDGGGNVVWQNPAVIAMGKVDAAASTVNANGATVGRNGVGSGNYTVTLNTTIPSADYIIQLTLLNAGPDISIEVIGQNANSFTVQISQLSISPEATTPQALVYSPVDRQWFFTVTDF